MCPVTRQPRTLRATRNTGMTWYFCLSIWLCRAACGIFVPRPGIEPGPSAVRVQSPNHWTAREFAGMTWKGQGPPRVAHDGKWPPSLGLCHLRPASQWLLLTPTHRAPAQQSDCPDPALLVLTQNAPAMHNASFIHLFIHSIIY